MVRFAPGTVDDDEAPPAPPKRRRKKYFARGAYSTIRAAYAETVKLGGEYGAKTRVMHQLNCSLPTVLRALAHWEDRKTKTSAHRRPGHKGRGISLAESHPAVVENRTLFRRSVRQPDGSEHLFKDGSNSAKVGGLIKKGKWAGFPVYTLTLEERASCPPCQHKLNCYGNGSPFSRRFAHGPALEWRVERELAGIELKHPKGFCVRLHMLGDFYSWAYVDLWRTLLARHPALHVFGFTAHVDTERDVIGRTLAIMVREWWPRFAIRFSDGAGTVMTTVSIDRADQRPLDAVICPAQTGAAESCSTCALCWQSTKRIAFLKH